jgi:hypothetical protein
VSRRRGSRLREDAGGAATWSRPLRGSGLRFRSRGHRSVPEAGVLRAEPTGSLAGDPPHEFFAHGAYARLLQQNAASSPVAA